MSYIKFKAESPEQKEAFEKVAKSLGIRNDGDMARIALYSYCRRKFAKDVRTLKLVGLTGDIDNISNQND